MIKNIATTIIMVSRKLNGKILVQFKKKYLFLIIGFFGV